MNKKETTKKKSFSGEHKKTIGIILLIVVILVIAIIVWGMRQPKTALPAQNVSEQSGDFRADIIYYYGKGACLHCKNIDKIIEDNKIESKISFAKKEVWQDPVNDMEMRERAEICALDVTKVGVPFLWARGKCYVGEVEVSKFLKKEIGLE